MVLCAILYNSYKIYHGEQDVAANKEKAIKSS